MKIAIVTGASSGMGALFVKQIERLYHDLDEIWVIARRRERMETLQNHVKTNLRIFEGDLRSESTFRQLESSLKEYQPDLRMLVNAAGFGKVGSVEKIAEEEQLHMIDVNCKSLTHMILSCLPYCSRGTRIVNLASAASFCPQPSFAVYAATKSYVLSFSRALGVELSEKGIFVTAVCPGPVETEFFDIAGNSGNALKVMSMAKPEKVVKQALLDARKRKSVSIYGISMKSANVATKILPHRLVLKVMKRFWQGDK
ncbi:MAG: SDR family NAD(P)-dependent oxidoreductase [Lachnospiraceae bacterium]